MSTIEELVARAEALYHDLDFGTVRAWQAETGGKAIGWLPIYVPREIIHAAGMLPVGLMGAGGQMEIIRGDAFFQSYICQIPRSTIELAMAKRLDFLSGFLFPSICDVMRNLSGMWKILFPERYVRYLDVPQNFDPAVGGCFYRRELESLAEELGALSGIAVNPARLKAAIAAYDDNRRVVRELLALRQAQPWRVPAYESYLVLRAGNVMPVEAHTSFVRVYLDAARQADRPIRDCTRIVTVGSFCEQPPLELIKTLEVAGCYIVWDDAMLGHYWHTGDVGARLPAEGGDPMGALVDAYLNDSASTSSRYEGDAEKGLYLRELMAKVGAEGVIFAAPSFCDPALLEQPMLQDACDKHKIPWTAFKYAESLGQFQVIREQAGTFADSVKLWSEP
jgi:benzoyl-CoA reductase subunit C